MKSYGVVQSMWGLSRFRHLFAAIAAALGMLGMVPAQAADYPGKAIRLIVGAPGGSPTDLIARQFSAVLQKRLGQSVVIENRPGTGIANRAVAGAAADGYTLLFTVDSYLTVNPTLYPGLGLDVEKELVPVGIVAALNNFVLAVHPRANIRTAQDYVTLAKGKPRSMTVANVGIGSPAQLVALLFQQASNIEAVNVPYKGGNLAVQDLMGGHVDSMFVPAQLAVGPVKSGMLVPLAVTGTKRFSLLPDVPTLIEAGLPALDMNQGFWYGVLAPTGTPSAVVAVLAKEFAAISESPEIVKALGDMGIEAKTIGPAEMTQIIRADTLRWSAIIKRAGIKAE